MTRRRAVSLWLPAAIAAAITFGVANGARAAEIWPQACKDAPQQRTSTGWYECVSQIKSNAPVTVGGLGPSSASGFGAGVHLSSLPYDLKGLVAGDGSYVVRGGYAKSRLGWSWSAVAEGSDLHRVPYYGLGPSSQRSALSYYRETRNTIGAGLGRRTGEWLNTNVALSYIAPDIGRTASGLPSTFDLFTPSAAPGLLTQPGFVNLRLTVSAHTPDTKTRGTCRPTYTDPDLDRYFNACFAYEYFADTRSGAFSFHRAELLTTLSHRFTARGKAEPNWLDNLACQEVGYSDRLGYDRCSFATLVVNAGVTMSFGRQVPFYLQKTLGGVDIDGVDTLRGFDSFRFRAPNRELVQVELYKGLFGPIGAYGFFDAGKVAMAHSDLGAGHIKHDLGVGAYIGTPNGILLRAYVAGGGGEGLHPSVRLGAAF